MGDVRHSFGDMMASGVLRGRSSSYYGPVRFSLIQSGSVTAASVGKLTIVEQLHHYEILYHHDPHIAGLASQYFIKPRSHFPVTESSGRPP
jgi:hypothetical protein